MRYYRSDLLIEERVEIKTMPNYEYIWVRVVAGVSSQEGSGRFIGVNWVETDVMPFENPTRCSIKRITRLGQATLTAEQQQKQTGGGGLFKIPDTNHYDCYKWLNNCQGRCKTYRKKYQMCISNISMHKLQADANTLVFPK